MSGRRYPIRKTRRERVLIALLKADQQMATPLGVPKVTGDDWRVMRGLVADGFLKHVHVETGGRRRNFYLFTEKGAKAAHDSTNRSELDIADAKRRYLECGESARQIAGDKYSETSVLVALKNAGVTLRPRGGRPSPRASPRGVRTAG
jgi:hypothetical protein